MKTENTGGIGFFGVLTVLFVALKLTNYITCNWWWVLSPTLIPTGLTLIILVYFILASLKKW